MLRLIAIIALFFTLSSISYAQYEINFDLKNYEKDTLVIGYYFGSQTLVQDTLVKKNDRFTFKGEESLPSGVYMALRHPDNAYIQFFIPEDDQKFDVEWDVNTIDPIFKGSRDNQIFQDYASFLTKKRGQLDLLQKKIGVNKVMGKDTASIVEEINQLDQEVYTYQDQVIEHNPGTMSALILKGNRDPIIPAYTSADGNVEELRYKYFKKHYFDNIDLGNPQILRTPFIQEKIMYYMDKLVSYQPDSINKEIDYILEKMEPAPRTHRFYLGEFLDKYANTRIIGLDAVFVHIADKYYSVEKTPWVPEESMKEIKRLASNMKSTLIGNQFPSVTTFKKDKTPVNINQVKSPYKLVVFWSHTCSHCKESLPALVKFNEEFKNKGVKVITICTKGKKRAAECMQYVDDQKNMDGMINTFDAKRSWAKSVYVPTTPGVFLLDKNNKILLKDLPINKLSELMPKIFKMYP